MADILYEADLTVDDGFVSGRRIAVSPALDAGEPIFIIGSSPNAHLLMEGLAATHAGIRRRDNSYFIQPRSAECAVYVNGRRISGPTCLLPGDKVLIGGIRMRFDQREVPNLHFGEPSRSKSLLRKLETKELSPTAPAAAPTGYSQQELLLMASASAHKPARRKQKKPKLTSLILGAATLVLVVVVVVLVIIESFHLNEAPPRHSSNNTYAATLIMFEAGGCASCDLQRLIVNGVGAQYQTSLSVQFINVDDDRYQYLEDYYGVQVVPTLLILDSGGYSTDIFHGGADAGSLRAAVERALAR